MLQQLRPAVMSVLMLTILTGLIFPAVILLFSVVYVLVNLLIDTSYVFFDPRIRY